MNKNIWFHYEALTLFPLLHNVASRQHTSNTLDIFFVLFQQLGAFYARKVKLPFTLFSQYAQYMVKVVVPQMSVLVGFCGHWQRAKLCFDKCLKVKRCVSTTGGRKHNKSSWSVSNQRRSMEETEEQTQWWTVLYFCQLFITQHLAGKTYTV